MRNLHLKLAHLVWAEHLKGAASVIDATAGNGHDALFLAKHLSLTKNSIFYVFDIQKQAIEITKTRIEENSLNLEVHYFHQSHHPFPTQIEAKSIDLIIYNLGYLPGGDKSITTKGSETVLSLKEAYELLRPGGLLSITCYPGHAEGAIEHLEVKTWIKQLSPSKATIYELSSNKETAPELILVRKDLTLDQKST